MTLKNFLKITLLLSLLVSKLYAQNHDEWIDPNAEYLKISVTKEGFCRVFPADLSAASFNLNSIDPRSFRLLRRGKECTVRVVGEQDGVFGTGDYLEFYAYPNDGLIEKELYFSGAQMHPYYSLYTDTAAYFLTWGGLSGKRIESIAPASQIKESSKISAQNLFLETGNFLTGIEPAPETFYSEGDFGEGFASGAVRNNASATLNYSLSGPPLSSGEGELEIQVVGAYSNSRQITFIISSGGNSFSFVGASFSGYEIQNIKIPIPANFLTNAITVNFSPVSKDNRTDFVAMNFIRIKYAVNKNWSTLSRSVFVDLEPNAKASLQLNPANYTFYLVSDSSSWTQIGSANTAFEIHNDSSFTQKYFCRYNNSFFSPAKLQKAEFVDTKTAIEYLIVTHSSLLGGSLEFLNYKKSTLGGSRDAAIFEIEKLYNTFSFGDKNPIAIRNLVRSQYALGKANALMIIGRGLTPNYMENGKFYRKTPYDSKIFSFFEFVPSFGQPGSDLCFSQNILTQTPHIPVLATGRLTALNNEMIFDYVSKLKEHAALTSQETWTKKLLHLSGGKTSQEANYFYSIIDGWKQQAVGEYLGAKVELFSKKTTQPVELYNISEQVNEGLSMVSYVGHSAPNTIEIDIGDVTDPTNGYRNKGKYPVLFINGCNSLDVFNSYTRTENWVNASDKGAIAAFGHTRFGYTSPFQRYTEDFYEVAFQDSLFYGKSIGEIQLETIKRYGSIAPKNAINYTQMEQFGLIGDPDVKLLVPTKADFFVKENKVEVLPFRLNETISSSVDSIRLQFTIGNSGRVRKDSIKVCITRFYDDLKQSISYGPFMVATPGYEKTCVFDLYNKLESSNDENLFQIFVDCDDVYAEYNEQNNLLNFTYAMPGNNVKLLFPYPFAIVGESKIDFSVQSQDQNIQRVEYLLEISDEYDFSNTLVKKEILADNLAIFKNVELETTLDTSTFYWRARLKNIPQGEDTLWQEASFSIIPTKTGWGQFEYGQFRKDVLQNIRDDGSKLVFDSVFTSIKFETVGADFLQDFVKNTSIVVNERSITESLLHVGCNTPTFLVLPFDGTTLLSYKGKSASPYSACGLDPATTASFQAGNAGSRANMKSFLDSIPEGDYILLLSTSNNLIQNLDQDLKNTLHQFGSFALDTLKNGVPYAFIGRKGRTTPIFEEIDLDKSAKISETYLLKEMSNSGKISASNIGKSQNFSSWSWSFDGVSSEEFELILEDKSTLVYTKRNFNGVEDISIIQEQSLEQSAIITDKKNRSLSPISHWAFSYDIAPEGIVVPSINTLFNQSNSTIYQGDSMKVKVSFVNVSSTFFDSVWVYWSVRHLATNRMISDSSLLSKLYSKDTLDFYLKVFETSFLDNVEVSIIFNPKKQLEQDYTNNTYYQKIKTVADLIPPITELKINGEIPKTLIMSNKNPLIEVFIADNNQKVIKKDTLGIEMYLSGPCLENQICPLKPVYFSNQLVSWREKDGKMYIRLEYQNLDPGIYEFKVFSSDAFGNINKTPASLSFEIEAQTELSYFLPYPSPFSSEMRFAYQMKGFLQPKDLKIQVLSSSGVLVYELDQTKLGQLKPGNNLTEWSWDGRDFKGAILPNGVYLYRVILNDADISSLKTDADGKFKDGWGTILIAR